MTKIPEHVEFWDDERKIGNSLIVTLEPGLSFEEREHCGVRGFDTIKAALRAVARKRLFPCYCLECGAAIRAVREASARQLVGDRQEG